MPHSYNARAQDLASKGRYGDSMLVHMNPSEVRGLEQGRGVGLTRNPDTGLPEAIWPILIPIITGALIGGASQAVFGNKDVPFWKRVGKGAAMGAIGGGVGSVATAGIGGALSSTAGTKAMGNMGSLFTAAPAAGSAGAGIMAPAPGQFATSAFGGAGAPSAPVPVASTTSAPVPAASTTPAPVSMPVTTPAPVSMPVTTPAPVSTPVTTPAPVSTPVLTPEHTTWAPPVGAPEGWNPALERQYSEAIRFHPDTTRSGIMDAHEIATWNKMPWYEKAQSKPGRFAMEYGPAGLMMGGLGLGMMNRGGGGTSPWISGPVSRFSEDPSLPASWEVHDEFIEEEERDRVG